MSTTASHTPVVPPSAIVRVPFIIDLPHEGFNPSIVRWRGKLLLAWRRGWFSARMWLGELSEDHRLLWGREMDFSRIWNLSDEDWLEDPRLIVADDKVLVAFTYVRHSDIFMALATLNEELEVAECRIMNAANRRWEKNWQFFDHDRVLHTVYYPNPHTVGWRSGQEIRVPAAHGARLDWAWGEVRGGTPPVRVGDEYFSFFHSSLHCHYVAGFYAFEAKPPFRVTRWPVQPCMVAAKDKWRGGHAVVFPAGAILENGKWLVAFGWQDAFCCLKTFDHEALLATLIPRQLPIALLPPPGKKAYHTAFTMEPPRSLERVVHPRVKLVTAFVDLGRREARPHGKDAPAYEEHARKLFAANPPLVVWLDCDEDLEARIREAAVPFPNITIKLFRCEDTETWQAAAGAGSLALPRHRDQVKDTAKYFTIMLLKSELVARSICEGDIPSGMCSGWIDFGISRLPGVGDNAEELLTAFIHSGTEKIRIPGLLPPHGFGGHDCMESVHWFFCGGLFVGPQALLLKFAGEVLQALRLLLSRGEITWEVNVWALIYRRHPEWFSWYEADFDERMLRIPAVENRPWLDLPPAPTDSPRRGENRSIFSLPVYLIARHENQAASMTRIAEAGWSDVTWIPAILGEHAWGCAQSHARAATQAIERGAYPFLILEDDAWPTRWFRDVPLPGEAADAFRLDASQWGWDHQSSSLSGAQWEDIASSPWVLLRNMLGAAAVGINHQGFAETYVAMAHRACAIGQHIDILMISVMATHTIMGLHTPIIFQGPHGKNHNAGVTEVELPEDGRIR